MLCRASLAQSFQPFEHLEHIPHGLGMEFHVDKVPRVVGRAAPGRVGGERRGEAVEGLREGVGGSAEGDRE